MQYMKNSSACLALPTARSNGTGISPILESSVERGEALSALIGFGVFAGVFAHIFNIIRRKVYKDKNNLDQYFDAGGNVSIGLTATTIVSQWAWSSAILNSSSTAIKYGISGPMWYAAGATIQILMFAMMTVQLKIKAPGAKTFLQVIKARFGERTHIVYCAFALIANIMVTAILMRGGAVGLTILVKDLSVEYTLIVLTAVIGGYTYIGGLGATFYISYFNTTIMFIGMVIFMLRVYNTPDDPSNAIGTIDRVYKYMSCSANTDGDGDYMDARSIGAFFFGINNIIGNFGAAFADQSYWQSGVAAKPRQGVWGFLTAGMTYMAVPLCMSTTLGFAYLAISAENGEPLLSTQELNAGLAAPVVARNLLGKQGEILMLFMVLMTITSTGSAEIMAVTSIIIYDIYSIHLKPYRRVTDNNSCILCGKQKGRMANPRDKCNCISMTFCEECARDDTRRREDHKRLVKPAPKCRTHGPYRAYTEYMMNLKSWSIIWTTLAIFPLSMLFDSMGVSLGWIYLFIGVLTSSTVVPIALALTWTRVTPIAMMSSAIGGAALALIVWLATAATYDGGLSLFLENTGRDIPMLCANMTSLSMGALICFIVTMITGKSRNEDETEDLWDSTRDIDNPLSPWTEMYAREMGLTGAHQLDNRPSLREVDKAFAGVKRTANIGALVLTFILLIIWPATMLGISPISQDNFTHWVNFSLFYGFLTMLFIVIVPLVFEVWDIWKKVKTNKSAVSATLSFLYPTQSNEKVDKLDTTAPVIRRSSSKCTANTPENQPPSSLARFAGNDIHSDDINEDGHRTRKHVESSPPHIPMHVDDDPPSRDYRPSSECPPSSEFRQSIEFRPSSNVYRPESTNQIEVDASSADLV